MNTYNKYPRQKSMKDHRPIRWVVWMPTPNSQENVYGNDNFVSYHNNLDAGPVSSLAMGINTAQRYAGKLYADYGPDSELVLVKSYN